MNCRECVEMLMEFLSGDLDAEVREEYRRHLEQCPPCVTYIETYQVTIHVSRRITHARMPADAAVRLLTMLKDALGEE